MKVRYTIDALLHIGAIHTYIDERNPVAASRVIARVRAAAARLGEHPRISHAGTVAGTREWVVTGLPYVIVYEFGETNDEIVVLASITARRSGRGRKGLDEAKRTPGDGGVLEPGFR